MIRYVIKPGPVTSQSDGQRHFVSFEDLRRLYRVKREECIFWPGKHQDPRGLFKVPAGCVLLEPRYDGNYSLPEASGHE